LYLAEDSKYGHLVSEWHPTKNGEFTPQNTSSGSGRSIWWKCSTNQKHEWTASPLTRAKQTQGCPFCSGKRVFVGENDLATTHPHLVAEWHPTLNTDVTPEKISAGSNKGVFWICPVGSDHVWNAAPNTRKRGSTCPYCANRKVLAGFNDLASNSAHAHIVSEWHPTKNESLSPTEVTVYSNSKVWWKCSNNHEWEAVIANRTRVNTNCPKCKKENKREVRLVSDDPLLLKEWSADNSASPKEIGLGSGYMAKWVCSINESHCWNASVVNRFRGKGSGCPYCSNSKILSGYNDLGSSKEHASIISEWHPDNTLDIHTVGLSSDINVKWICKEGHEWEAKIYSRTVAGAGCPECAGRSKWTAKKKRVADYPALVAQWHPDNTLSIHDVPFRSAKKILWVCGKNKKHLWTASVFSRSLDGSDCAVCAGRIVIKGVNDLGSYPKYAHIVAEWHPDNSVLPSEVTYSSGLIVKWQCQKDQKHDWETTVAARTHNSSPSGCPHCALAKKASKGEEELNAILTLLGFSSKRSMKNIIPRQELDIYIPEKKFAVEFNGLYWHSEAIRSDKEYHKKKVDACNKVGIYLYQVWEDDWRDKKDIVIRGLAHRLGVTHKLPEVLPNIPAYWYEKIGARSTMASLVTNSDAREFLDTHHIQGFASGSHYVGLKDKSDRIRAVMVLSSTGNDGELRIDRYASAGIVSGGFTKALKFAEQELPVKSFVTFADRAISNGSLYEQNGFVLDKVLDVDYSYLAKGCRIHKFNYRIKRFKTDRELTFKDGLTERELAKLNVLHRIWDSGKNRYVKDVTIKR
jgi:hypothetical protein